AAQGPSGGGVRGLPAQPNRSTTHHERRRQSSSDLEPLPPVGGPHLPRAGVDSDSNLHQSKLCELYSIDQLVHLRPSALLSGRPAADANPGRPAATAAAAGNSTPARKASDESPAEWRQGGGNDLPCSRRWR